MKKILLLLLLIASGFISFAQAKLFAPGIISNNDVFGITISQDNNKAYFVRSWGGRDSMRIYESIFVNGQWKTATLASFNIPQSKNIDPFLSNDGKILLFNSNSGGNFDIWAVKKQNNKWGDPYHTGKILNSDSSDFFATMAANGNIYFSSTRSGGFGGSDIYMSRVVGGIYQTPVNLGTNLNSKGYDSNPFIAPDESYMIYYTEREDSFGDSDLYISFRRNNDWSKPINLGSKVNTAFGEFCPFVSFDKKHFYFARLERLNGKLKENIYVIDIKELNLQELKARAIY